MLGKDWKVLGPVLGSQRDPQNLNLGKSRRCEWERTIRGLEEKCGGGTLSFKHATKTAAPSDPSKSWWTAQR